jgi:hypothetical protein
MIERSEKLKVLIEEEKQRLIYNLENNIISEIKDGHYILHHYLPFNPRKEICVEFSECVSKYKGLPVNLILDKEGRCTYVWRY